MVISEKSVCEVPIAGIQPMTTIDFPGKIASVLFTQGCTWQCRYCHNSSLCSPDNDTRIGCSDVSDFLNEHAGFIEGIVLSGGEPTLHSALPNLLMWLRKLGYSAALHTNGSFPIMLSLLLNKRLVDYVAMDVKAPPAAYDRVTRTRNSCIAVSRGIDIILSSGVDCEFRTTYHPDILSEQDLMDIIHAPSKAGAKRYFIQRFQSRGVSDPDLVRNGKVIIIPAAVIEEAQRCFDVFEVR